MQLSGPAFICGSKRSTADKHAVLLVSPTAVRQQAMCLGSDYKVQLSCSNVANASGSNGQASQGVHILELISAHASITPAHTMPTTLFICFCSSCGLPEKGSEAVSVVVGAHRAGRAHTDYVGDCRLVPGLARSLQDIKTGHQDETPRRNIKRLGIQRRVIKRVCLCTCLWHCAGATLHKKDTFSFGMEDFEVLHKAGSEAGLLGICDVVFFDVFPRSSIRHCSQEQYTPQMGRTTRG